MPAESGRVSRKQKRITDYFPPVAHSARSKAARKRLGYKEEHDAEVLRLQTQRVYHVAHIVIKMSQVKHDWETQLLRLRQESEALCTRLFDPDVSQSQIGDLLEATLAFRTHLQTRNRGISERGTEIIIPTVGYYLSFYAQKTISTETPSWQAYRCIHLTLASLQYLEDVIEIHEDLVSEDLKHLYEHFATILASTTKSDLRFALSAKVMIETLQRLLDTAPEEDPVFRGDRAACSEWLRRLQESFAKGNALFYLEYVMMKCCFIAATLGVKIARQRAITEFFRRR